MKQLSINPLSKLYMHVVVCIFFLSSPLLFGQETLDIDLEQNKKIEALEKKIEELEEMMVDKNLSGDIKANSISIVNKAGKTQISIEASDGGGYIRAINSDDKVIAYLGASQGNSGLLSIYNKLGEETASIYSKDENDPGGKIAVYHPSGENAAAILSASIDDDGKEFSVLVLQNKEGHGVYLSAEYSGSQMNIYHKNKKTVFLGAAIGGSGMLALNNTDSNNLVFLGPSEAENGMLSLFNKNSNQIVYLGPNQSNHGLIIINDRDGEDKWSESGQR